MASDTKGVVAGPHHCLEDQDLHHDEVLGQLWPLSNNGIVACPVVMDHGGLLFEKYVD